MTEIPFIPFPKISRLSREIIISEKIDGTNAQIYITDDGEMLVGSRTRWITPGKDTDNYGFAAWAEDNKEDLLKLGPGQHFGEWWGKGIQRNYGLNEKRFSLFNATRWNVPERPTCCFVVPTLYVGPFTTDAPLGVIEHMRLNGSVAAPGFMKPEGIIVYHSASKTMFKKTLDKDESYKGAEA